MTDKRLKTPQDLRSELPAANLNFKEIAQIAKRYAIGITPHVLKTMGSSYSEDPVARQYIPQVEELAIAPEERQDPIGDETHTAVKGIIHRYPDRVLFKPVSVCAVYCRYCFRREKVGPGREALTQQEQTAALEYIRGDKKIWEVILSGGDPLILSPRRIKEIMDSLDDIQHVQTLRIHTRIPVADPERVTDALCAALQREKAVYIVVHINHAQEITAEVVAAFKKLQSAGCILLSQSVLLKDVNDKADTLEHLFRRLTALKVRPYYLHHPDLAPGTSHFRLPLAKGRAIMKTLLGRLSGIARPAYMLDIPGGYGKVPVGPCHLEELEPGHYLVEDSRNRKHHYPSKDKP